MSNYVISKPAGIKHPNVTITNTDTGASIILGRLTPNIISILNTHDIKPNVIENWYITVPEEAGQELIASSWFKGRKPKIKPIEPKWDIVKQHDLYPNIKAETETKKYNAYDYLFGYTDELNDE